MLNSLSTKNFKPNSTIVTNTSIVKADNIDPLEASAALCVRETPCLILFQCVNKCKIHLGEDLTYTIYMINNTNSNITGVHLLDTLPESTKFISSSMNIQQGKYKYSKGKVVYKLNTIEEYSIVKIILTIHPRAVGILENIIEVTSKEHSKFTINNPSNIIAITFKKNSHKI
jgi:uncharacterized repeat protein (TIGR01451 family)